MTVEGIECRQHPSWWHLQGVTRVQAQQSTDR
jgi:hypothetical protein